MCKINGQSIFKWMFATPLAVVDEVKRQKDKKKQTSPITTETVEKVSDIETNAATATNAKVNDTKRNDISSLRIPLNTSSTGASTGGNTSVGLNLGGY